MRRAAAAISTALLAISATGCFRIGVTVGAEIPDDRVARIVPGVTTKDDILRWFGAPAEATDGEIFARMFDVGEIAAEDLVALPFSDMLVYEITDGEARILMTILFNWARVDLKRDRLVIFFDERDVVLYFGVTRQRGDGEPAEEDGAEDREDEEDHELEHPEDAEEEMIDSVRERDPVIEYLVLPGDSLSSIAKAHYGDPSQYGRILEANPQLRGAPDRLVPGQVLRIPPR